MKVRAPSPDVSAIRPRHASTSLRALVRPFSRSSASDASVGAFFIVIFNSFRHGRAWPGHDDYGLGSPPHFKTSRAQLSDLPGARTRRAPATPPSGGRVITEIRPD